MRKSRHPLLFKSALSISWLVLREQGPRPRTAGSFRGLLRGENNYLHWGAGHGRPAIQLIRSVCLVLQVPKLATVLMGKVRSIVFSCYLPSTIGTELQCNRLLYEQTGFKSYSLKPYSCLYMFFNAEGDSKIKGLLFPKAASNRKVLYQQPVLQSSEQWGWDCPSAPCWLHSSWTP